MTSVLAATTTDEEKAERLKNTQERDQAMAGIKPSAVDLGPNYHHFSSLVTQIRTTFRDRHGVHNNNMVPLHPPLGSTASSAQFMPQLRGQHFMNMVVGVPPPQPVAHQPPPVHHHLHVVPSMAELNHHIGYNNQ